MNRTGPREASRRRQGDKWERRCYGPAHDEPTWLPETAKFFILRKTGRQAGQFYSRCHLCKNWERVKSPGTVGYVPDSIVRPFVIEGVHKVGMSEFARRVGVADSMLKQIIERPGKRKQKKVVRRIMLELISIRRKGEVRHRDSIKAGRLARGLPDKEVTSPADLYKPRGDDYQERLEKESAFKRDQRAKMTPEERESFRQQDRQRKRVPSLTR